MGSRKTRALPWLPMRAVRPHRCTKALREKQQLSVCRYYTSTRAVRSHGNRCGALTWHCWEGRTAAPIGDQGCRCLWPSHPCTPGFHWETERKRHSRFSSTKTNEAGASPFQAPKVGEDLVAFVFHLAVDAADVDLLYQSLQRAAKVFHTGAGAEEAKAEGHCKLCSILQPCFTHLKKTRFFSCLCCRRNATSLLNLSSDLQICQ